MNTEPEQTTPLDEKLQEVKEKIEKLVSEKISALMQECMDISLQFIETQPPDEPTSTAIVKSIKVEVNLENDEVNLTTDIGIFTNNQKS